jgi:hypothetical protein
MAPFGREFYRALAIGFLIGCAGMALSATGGAVQAHTPMLSLATHIHPAS